VVEWRDRRLHNVTRSAAAMTYAQGRRTLDADSHLMELPDFLDPFIEASLRDRLRRRGMDAVAPLVERATDAAARRRTDAAVRTEAEERLLVDKGWAAMGAFDPTERSHVVDLLGFDGQLVFATFATAMFMGRDLDLLHAGSAAHNRAVAAFCDDDPRLLPVAFVPLHDTERAVQLLTEAIELGCAAVHVPSTAAGDRSPSHPDLDPFWARLAESGLPFVLHVGGGGRLLDRAFHDNGRPVTDHLGGGENIRSKDFLAIAHSPSLFLGTLILDGMFDRFPGLRGGVIEEGAGWVVSWRHQLDFAQRAFSRTEEPLRQLERTPSEYLSDHLWFTPFPGEPVGWMIEQAGADLFMFSTDYPHPEGGRDPRGKFEAAMTDVSDEDRDRFYYGNMAALLGPALTPVAA
jgi:predicted TIM-barrel fold metal-dependent hydrolase